MASRPLNLEELRAARQAKLEQDEADREVARDDESVREEAARLAGDLRGFIRAAWPILEPATPYRHNWHIDAIADHLEAAYNRDIRRLIINVPPRRMKSLTVTVFGPAWRWTSRPEERFLTASYVDALALEHSVNTRTILNSAWYQRRWGHMFSLTSDQNVKGYYLNDRRGYRIATSVKGSGTGRGGDVIVIDDPLDADDAHSPTARLEAINWYDQKITTRLNDPKTGVVILVMQRLHEEDLTGHLLAKEAGWHHLCLPEEYEPRLMVTLPGGRTLDATCPPLVELPSGRELQGDPRDEPGELLWPEHVPADTHEEQKRDLGPYATAGQLQQRPSPAEGGILKTAWWRYYDPANLDLWQLPPLVRLVTFWDTALKDKTTSDYTVGTVWGASGANRYLLRRFRGRVGLPDAIQAVADMNAWVQERFPGIPHSVCVENAANGPEVVAKLRNRITGIRAVNAEKDKVTRAHAITPELAAGQVFVPGGGLPDGSGADPTLTPAWVIELVGECAAFPNAANDDQVDSVAGALADLKGNLMQRTGRADRDDRTKRAVTAGLRERTF